MVTARLPASPVITRPRSSASGTMAVPRDDIIVLDALRRQRNITDYEGDPVSEATLAGCIEHAARLLAHTEHWLHERHPELSGDV